MDSAPSIPGAPSRRLRLARAALAAALTHPDVVGAHPGPSGLHITADSGAPLTGVTAVAEAGGRYGVELHLVARPVPLHALGTEVSDLVRRAAAERGLGLALGPITVAFEDIVEVTV